MTRASEDADVWWTCTIHGMPDGTFRHSTLASAFNTAKHLSKWQHRIVDIVEFKKDGTFEKIGEVKPPKREKTEGVGD